MPPEFLDTWYGLPGSPHVPSWVLAHILACATDDWDTCYTVLEALDYSNDSFDLWAYAID